MVARTFQRNDRSLDDTAPSLVPIGVVRELAADLLAEHETRARKNRVKVLLYPYAWLSSYKIRRLDDRIAELLSVDSDSAASAKSVAEAVAQARLPRKIETRVVGLILRHATAARGEGFVDEFLDYFRSRLSIGDGPADFFFILQAAGRYQDASAQGVRLLAGQSLRPTQRKQIEAAPSLLIETLTLIEEGKPPQIKSNSKHIAYIAASSLPYSIVGYTTRTHGVAQGYAEAGFKIDVITQPHFPLSVREDLDPSSIPALEVFDGVSYHRILAPRRNRGREVTYVKEAAEAIEAKLRQLKPAVVIAASNYMNSLPALIAARSLGLPFVYEVRGMWELSRVSRESSFEHTPEFAVTALLEAEVARRADYVLTLTEPMRQNLTSRGVDPERVALMPNGITASAVRTLERDDRLADKLGIPRGTPVIGYIGSILPYEGLPDLASACAGLAKLGVDFRLLVVGKEGKDAGAPTPISDEMRDIFYHAGIADRLIMPGRVPHSEVSSFYSLIDIAPIPRRSFEVTELVSPIKPIEALAMRKVLIVSDVEALKDFTQEGRTGIQFKKDSIADLEEKLALTLSDSDLRARLAANGQEFVRNERTWQTICQNAARFIGLS